MAQRAQEKTKEKTKRRAVRQKPVAAGQAKPARGAEERARALERERDELQASLEAAKARIAALEESRRQIAGRIDWVIDSLQTLVERSD